MSLLYLLRVAPRDGFLNSKQKQWLLIDTLRQLESLRRLIEEKDAMYGYNGLKYFSIIAALAMRTTYDLQRGMTWKIMAVSSGVATIIATYWDIVIDWGLLRRVSDTIKMKPHLMETFYIVRKGLFGM
ncbi:phosphate transporter PHO1 homolog 10-like [Carya illinoinensis]|nr:phosphate transporter PHO1 homolog 10-like [Carya illinoinensis]XP_042990456.1 phosphate transporter PHO1 homolog 10-like [Carya illinoinensis]